MTKERKTLEVTITKMIEVEYDLEKFTEEAMNVFNDNIYYVGDKPEEHLKNMVEMYAKGLSSPHIIDHGVYIESEFIEGYGVVADFGVKFNELSEDASSEFTD
ncbi:hypothetical protein AU106_gp213 [Sinorhizobium phage phiM9]|uniref:Uncharacterized protein n=1 Tax=Sinorhizobium phage phiM9 TaxID=1636182 RepID=A0A0F6THL9_9CAUD|nr:hypothetical protein AU106_gp213 [Sinorhizobium phage phiM9]AKE44844.1 hypothetical protein Sm_phiM9_217 [Sinorhizobium phage phiM9]